MGTILRFLVVAGFVCFGHTQVTCAGIPEALPTSRPPKISKLAADSGVLVITAADASGGKPAEFCWCLREIRGRLDRRRI